MIVYKLDRLELSIYCRIFLNVFLMDRLHYRQNFKKYLNSKIHYHGIKEHPKLSKIAKFGCKML